MEKQKKYFGEMENWERPVESWEDETEEIFMILNAQWGQHSALMVTE